MAVHKNRGRPPLCDYVPALLSGSVLIIGVADGVVARNNSCELSESTVFGGAFRGFLFSAIFLLHAAISLRDGEEVQENVTSTLLNLRF